MPNEHNHPATNTSKRGFASMDQEKQRAIASKGGHAAHAQGKAHRFTTEEARIAGRKGGEAAHARGTAHEFTAEEARRAGQKGGRYSRRAAADTTEEPIDSSARKEALAVERIGA